MYIDTLQYTYYTFSFKGNLWYYGIPNHKTKGINNRF